MTFTVALLIIDSIITVWLISKTVSVIDSLPSDRMKLPLFNFFMSPPITFAINFLISCLITGFTNSGLSAGTANLGSSILVGVFLPPYLRSKYNIDRLRLEIKNNPSPITRITNIFSKNKKMSTTSS